MRLSTATDPIWPVLGDKTALCSLPGAPALCRDGQISGGSSHSEGQQSRKCQLAIAFIQDESLQIGFWLVKLCVCSSCVSPFS